MLFPLVYSGKDILTKFLQVLAPSSEILYVITGNYPANRLSTENVKFLRMSTYQALFSESIWKRIAIHIIDQIRLTHRFMNISREVDVAMFPHSFSTYLIQLLIAKIMRKKVIVCATGSATKSSLYLYGRYRLMPKFWQIFEQIGYKIADRIVTESLSVVSFHRLEKYQKKIFANGGLFVDTKTFKFNESRKDRKNRMAYIGRLTAEKGIMQLIKAIPLIISKAPNMNILIAGGQQCEIPHSQLDHTYTKNVQFIGWVPVERMPDFLNSVELVIIPSYTEGLPNILLESMACGAIAVATPAGGIPDLLKDSKTGFLLNNNSPESIAEGVLRVLNYPKLEEIANNAYDIIKRNYTLKAARERYKRVINWP